MTNVVITGHTSFKNRGNEALVRTTIQGLADWLGNGRNSIRFTVFSQTPEYDRRAYVADATALENVHFVPLIFNPGVFYRKGRAWFAMQKRLGKGIRSWLRVDNVTFEAIKSCDLLVVSGGDLLSGYELDSLMLHSHLALVAAAMGKPTVVYAHSFNPYKSPSELDFARRFLNSVSLITVREKISQSYLDEIGLSTPVHLAADPAFWLSPAEDARIDEILNIEGVPMSRPLAGISASAGMAWYIEGAFEKYTNALADFADYLIYTHEMAVVFISHVIGPNQFGGDDRLAAQSVLAKMKHRKGAFDLNDRGSLPQGIPIDHGVLNRQHAYLLRGEYSARELKGLIGRCKLFIGSRMHTTVASTSMLVPTLGLAYSVKAHGVLGELIRSRPIVVDVPGLQIDKVKAGIDDLLQNHAAIALEMEANLKTVKEKALVTPRLAAQCIGGRAP